MIECSKIVLSLRIVTHLFYEHLLDREHYMNWVISSLQNCNLDNLSVWLLVVRIYWKEILRFRKRGKRLTEILSEQMFKVNCQKALQSGLTKIKSDFQAFKPKTIRYRLA